MKSTFNILVVFAMLFIASGAFAQGKILMVGDGQAISDLDLDLQDAYNWGTNNLANVAYASFADIDADATILDDAAVVWFYWDTPEGDANTALPTAAQSANVTTAMQNFLADGRNIFLSGLAVQYIVDLGVTTQGPNETGKAAPGFENADNWGFGPCPGAETHPIFLNPNVMTDPFGTLQTNGAGGGLREDAKSWWVVANLASAFEGTPLASTEWDGDCTVLITAAEHDGPNGGKVISVGAGAYDWNCAGGSNTSIGELQNFTENILTYLNDNSTATGEVQAFEVPVKAFPNPTSDVVTIQFELEETAEVTLNIYDMQGRIVSQVLNETRNTGRFIETWNAREAAAGMYFYELRAGNKVAQGKLVVQ